MSGKLIRLAGGLAALLVILFIFSLAANSLGAKPKRTFNGVSVDGVNLGNLTREEGLQKLQSLEENLRLINITLQFKDRTWILPLQDVGLKIEKDKIMNNALKAGREGNLFKRLRERQQIRTSGLKLALLVKIDKKKLSTVVEKLAGEVTSPPKNAGFLIKKNDEVEIAPGENGLGINHELVYQNIMDIIIKKKEQKVTLTLVSTPPAITLSELQATGINGLLSNFITFFDSSKIARVYNIKVASAALDGLLIKPGQVVSFNEVVGPRSSEAGYKTAQVIINNELVPGVGGGVCQVSTTLYNCVLLAGLKIVERANHSLPVNYVPIGRDATVVYKAIDFKFKNDTNSYLLIKSQVAGSQLRIKIFGNTAFRKNVVVRSWVTKVLEPEVIYEKDPNLNKGEEVVKREGARGYQAGGERIFYNNGAITNREPLISSFYKPVNKIIAVGTLEQPAAKLLSQDLPPNDNLDTTSRNIYETPGEDQMPGGKQMPDEDRKPGSNGENPGQVEIR